MGSSKHWLEPFKFFDAVDMTANRTSAIMVGPYTDNIGIQISWTGTSPVGAIVVEGTQDDTSQPTVTPVWTAFDFGSSISIPGTAGTPGSHFVNINQSPFKAIRIRYTFTSGSGNLTAKVSAKSV